MEFPGVSQEGFSPPRKLQRPPVLPVNRRSVEVRRRVKEVFNTAGAESGERQKERRSRRASGSDSSTSSGFTEPTENTQALSLEELFGGDSAEDSESERSDDWLAALGAQLPEVTVYKKHKEKKTTTTFEPPRENVSPVYKVKEAGPQKVKVTEKAGRRFLSRLLGDGCDAGFLGDEMRGKWKRNSPASFSSPSETLADLPYQNTKRVFDCTRTGGKGKRPARIRAPSVTLYDSDLPPTSYVKRKEKTKLTEIRRDEGGPSLHLKATARSTRSDRDGGTDTYRVTKITSSSAPSPPQRAEGRGPPASRKSSDTIKQEMKRCYFEALSQQVEQKREQMERERRRDAEAERIHNETMQFCMWGKPGSGAPNLGSVRRSNISSAGIVPQEQLHSKGFCGTPFHLHVK